MKMPGTCGVAIVVVVSMAWLAVPGVAGYASATPPEQPQQPVAGPGGRDYPYASVERERVGTAPTGAFVFSPSQGGTLDRDETLPLVIFLHGYTAVDPELYAAWIEHIVRRGAVVIYPDYQVANPLAGAPSTFLGDMMTGIRAALLHLEERGERTGGPVAVVGHSLGGILAVNYAAIAAETGFPAPDALLVVEPGGCATCGSGNGFGVALPAAPSFPPSLLASVLVGSDDAVVGEADARWIWGMLSDLPAEQRAFARVRSDRHGQPPLVADHLLPQTSGRGTLDALDWNGLWRLFDVQLGCALPRSECERVFGSGDVADMGRWSDGQPVRSLLIEDPSARVARPLTSALAAT